MQQSTHAHNLPAAAMVCAPAVVVNGVSTGLDIGLSNYSLMLITLSFYTMCKSTTPVFLLMFAFIWGIERCVAPGPQPANAPGHQRCILLSPAHAQPLVQS
jgi:hypothetical protein